MAEVHVLSDGYAREEGDNSRVGSTVGFVRDGDALVVIDPGMVPSRSAILDPLAALGVEAGGDHRRHRLPSPPGSHHQRRPVPERATARPLGLVPRRPRGSTARPRGSRSRPAFGCSRFPDTRRRTSRRSWTRTRASWSSRTCGGWPTGPRRTPTPPIQPSFTRIANASLRSPASFASSPATAPRSNRPQTHPAKPACDPQTPRTDGRRRTREPAPRGSTGARDVSTSRREATSSRGCRPRP